MKEINITLEKFTENDFALYFELVNNEKVMEMITERAIEKDEAKTENSPSGYAPSLNDLF